MTITVTVVGIVVVAVALFGYVMMAGRGKLNQDRDSRLRPWLWLLPTLLPITVFLIYPVLNTIYLSFRSADSSAYVGLENYQFVFGDTNMLLALRNNALWLVFFTCCTLLFGLILAVLTDRVKYESAAKALIFLPMAISFVAAGVIWKFMYEYRPVGTAQIGTVNALLTTTVPGFQPQAWLVNRSQNNWALIIVGVWMWTGFAMVILSAALKGISKELLEAARIDGAGEFMIFFRILLPLLFPTLVVVGTTMVINVLKIFDIVYVMTNGNLGTEVIANRMYKEMFTFRNYGRASAIAVLLLVAIIPVMVVNVRRFHRGG